MRTLLVLGGIALTALFVGLDRLDFTDEREARDAAVARELMVRGELLTPVLGGEPHLEKPLLGYAPEWIGDRLTPGSPVGPRALKAGAAVALVLLTGWIGRRWFGRPAGLAAAAVLATSLALPLAARTDGVQVLASLLGWAAWAGLAAAPQGARPWRLTAAYGALAAVLVLAGPLPALWPLAAVALHLALSRNREGWRRVRPLAGLVLMLGVALPWYGAILERHGLEVVTRFAAFPYAGEARDPWYAAPARALGFLVVGFFPWSTLLPAAALYAWGRRGAGEADAAHPEAAKPVLAALVAALIPVLLAPWAPLPAALPALPAASLLAGVLLARLFAGEPLAGRAIAQAARLTAVAGTVAAVMLVWVASRLGEAAPALRLTGAFLLLVSWAPALAVFLGRPRVSPALFALTVALGTPLLALRVLPMLEGYLTARPVALAMEEVAGTNAPLLLVEPPPPSLRLRLERHLVEATDLVLALREYRAQDGYAYVAYPPRRENEVARAASPTPLEILLRTPILILARVGAT